jgi:hypothetical protein
MKFIVKTKILWLYLRITFNIWMRRIGLRYSYLDV